MRQHLIALAVMAILGCVVIVAFLMIVDAKSKARLRPASSRMPGHANAVHGTLRAGR
jgi:hypothetical protein